jgi:hypothetical protein
VAQGTELSSGANGGIIQKGVIDVSKPRRRANQVAQGAKMRILLSNFADIGSGNAVNDAKMKETGKLRVFAVVQVQIGIVVAMSEKRNEGKKELRRQMDATKRSTLGWSTDRKNTGCSQDRAIGLPRLLAAVSPLPSVQLPPG